MKKNIPIVFATDHNFVVQAVVAIHSLLKNSGNTHYDIIIIKGKDISSADEELIVSQVTTDSPLSDVRFISPDYDFKEVFVKPNFSEATYYRLRIPWLLPEYDKVIYADCDIIFYCSLEDLFYNYNLGANYFAGVNKRIYQNEGNAKKIKGLGLNPLSYINAGLVLVNCKLLRNDNLFPRFEKYLGSDIKLTNQDQDIINIVCKGRILLLPEAYNYQPDIIYRNHIQDYKLIHYTLKGKPWNVFTWGYCEWWDAYKETVAFDAYFYFTRHAQDYNSINEKIAMTEGRIFKTVYKIIGKIASLKKVFSKTISDVSV